jgi:hypothetical protein
MDDKYVGHLMSRRGLIGSAVALTGGLLSTQFFAVAGRALQIRCSPIALRDIWTNSQHQLVIALAETIIPESDTVGATMAHVDEFIAHMLGAWFLPVERTQFVAGLDQFASACLAATGAPFTLMPDASRTKYVSALDLLAVEGRLRAAGGASAFGLLEGWRNYFDGGDSDVPLERPDDPLRFFATFKELTLVGYYTSEVGAASIGYMGPIGAGERVNGPIGTRIWN